MPDTVVDTLEKAIMVNPSAARRIAHLIEAEGDPALMLRVTVSGGGCSGFQYGFKLEKGLNADDRVFDENGVKVVVDEVSLDYLAGSEVAYVEDLVGSAFVMRNPNATATCGCGTSFAI
jgi:iron-sulfur cluster insertion protein